MVSVIVFAATLLIAVLLSEFAARSVLSIPVIFLFSGFIFGNGILGLVHIDPENPIVSKISELALFSVLYVDGMRIDLTELRQERVLPARALLMGMPVVMVVMALSARWMTGLSWISSFLFAAALSPTDPVFASAIVRREDVPAKLRRLLNVESGVNDGLALPFVVVFLSLASGREIHPLDLAFEILTGVAIGIFVPFVAVKLCNVSSLFAASPEHAPFRAFSIGMLVLGVTSLARGNEFLGAFVAGVVVARLDPAAKRSFYDFGQAFAELLKFAAILIFGAILRPQGLAELGLGGWMLAIACLLLARPLSIVIALVGTGIDSRQLAAAAWFGPKGFASVFFSLLILKSGAAEAAKIFHSSAGVILLSMVLHSSTDVVLVRRLFRRQTEKETS